MTAQLSLFLRSFATLVVTAFAAGSLAHASGAWKSASLDGGTRNLAYQSTATLLGKATPIIVNFFCNPTQSKVARGTLGIEVQIGNVTELKAFRFQDFEGPDALTNGKKLLKVVAERANAPALSFDSLVSGWVPDDKKFSFGIASESRLTKSNERRLLQALASDVTKLRIIVTDPKDAKQKLEIEVPTIGKQAEFKALLADLK
jgi:hypothetical protein